MAVRNALNKDGKQQTNSCQWLNVQSLREGRVGMDGGRKEWRKVGGRENKMRKNTKNKWKEGRKKERINSRFPVNIINSGFMLYKNDSYYEKSLLIKRVVSMEIYTIFYCGSMSC